MKHLFFVVLLANIVFFLWEFNFGSWRQLSADIPSLEINANKILLLSEVVEVQQNEALEGEQQNDLGTLVAKQSSMGSDDNTALHTTSLNKLTAQGGATALLAETNTNTSQDDLASSKTISPVAIDTALECYDIGPFIDEESRRKWLDSLTIKAETFRFFSNEDSISNGFLVYYPAADTFAESKATFEKLQGQGVTDIWLFRKGDARGNISLGVFTTETRALRMQKVYADRDMMLKIKPRFKTKLQYYLRLSWDKKKRDVLSRAAVPAVEAIPELSIKPAECEF